MSDRQIVWIDEGLCTGCGACVDACPVGAIALEDGTARVDENLCTGCHACVDTCPQEAIAVVIEGRAVPVPQQQSVPSVQLCTPPAETQRGPIVAIGAEVLSRAAEALVRAVDRHLTQPSSKTGAAMDDSGTEPRGTRGGGGGGRRERRRRRGR